MGMPAVRRRWTAAEVRALMDETRPTPRYELIDGELLVTPSPRPFHQLAVGALHLLLHAYVHRHRLGAVLLSPADLELEAESIVQPDLFVLPRDAVVPREEWGVVKELLLAVEVLSPSSVRIDRFTKRRFFQRVGVPGYRIVDVDARSVERWTPDDERPELLDDRLSWNPPGAAEPLLVDLPAFFRAVWGESDTDSRFA